MLSSLTFSLMINASLDKFGRIDPSTSTVLAHLDVQLGHLYSHVERHPDTDTDAQAQTQA